MKPICFFLAALFAYSLGQAQTVTVSGLCMTGTISLAKEAATVDGKVAYSGTGTVMGINNVAVSVYWIDAPDNVWVLAYDGQPYFQSTCNTGLPPSTANPSCSWTEVTPGSCTGGTPLAINGTGTTLPVRWISFTAQKTAATVQLTWKTAFESGNQWSALAFVSSTGNATAEQVYSFTDAAPAHGKNYYRLRQSDLDGQTAYSETLAVDFAAVSFYTFRQTGNGIYQLGININTPVELTVVDLSGRKLFSRPAAQGMHRVDISPYAKGIYLLQLKNANRITTEKLIKH